jgi:hypothetical protein
VKVTRWWASLCALAAINITAWIIIAALGAGAQDRAQVLLSGIYVFGCAFRSFFPVYDIPRLCVVDSWVSRVLIGRSVATLAELAFAAQWAVYLHASEQEGVRMVSLTIVPLVAIAQACCWHAVLTTQNLGHVFENSLWGISATLIVISLVASGSIGVWALGGMLYVAYIFIFDVPMYWSRWKMDEAQGRKYLGLVQGLADVSRRSRATRLWEDWRSEVTWMTLYFSVGVWVSISLVRS